MLCVCLSCTDTYLIMKLDSSGQADQKRKSEMSHGMAQQGSHPLEPDQGLGPICERLVAGSSPIGPGRVQPEGATWFQSPVDPPPTEEAAGVGCIVVLAVVEVERFDDLGLESSL